MTHLSRTQVVVLAQFALYWAFVVVLLLAARDVYDGLLPQTLRGPGIERPAEIGTVLALTALLALLSIGVIRGWRWLFWLIVLAFLAGILRLPASALQLVGLIPMQDPAWYVVLQAVIGLIQFVTALAMLFGYRRAGVWGAF
jgi:hypothetical protein